MQNVNRSALNKQEEKLKMKRGKERWGGREDKEWHEEEEPQSGTSGTGDLSKEFTGILIPLLGCLWHYKKKKKRDTLYQQRQYLFG